MRWTDLRRSDIAGLDLEGMVAILPAGSIEQHSLHLPFGTDSILVTAVAERVEALRPASVVLLPTLWYGASWHHLGFPGTVSLDGELLARVLSGVVETAHESSGAQRFLILNGHGGNEPSMRLACERAGRRLGHVPSSGVRARARHPRLTSTRPGRSPSPPRVRLRVGRAPS